MAELVRVAGEDVPIETAVAVALGYCLAPEPTAVSWTRRSGAVGESIDRLDVSAFAYSTYDLIPGSSGPGIEPIDVLVAEGLNGQMRARHIAAALAVADEVSAALDGIGEDLRFWELDRAEISVRPESPEERAWPIWRAWTVLIGAKGVNLARTHKILHHKRPSVFPLLDRKTVRLIGSDSWGKIHDDLMATEDGWATLEEQVNRRLTRRGSVNITRLRLHDILLWCRATRNTAKAEKLGRQLLDGDG